MKIITTFIVLFFLVPRPGAADQSGSETVVREDGRDYSYREEQLPGESRSYPSYSLGGKAWFSHIYDHNHHSGALRMYGGEVNIDFTDKLSLGTTYLVGNDYLHSAERDVDRTDLDVAFKYQICPYLAGYFDFKRIDYRYTILGIIPNSKVEYNEKLNGVGFGIASALPISDTGLFVYLGGGYMPFIDFSNFDPLTDDVEADIDYLYNLEGGVGYFLPSTHLDFLLTLGYRLQDQRMIRYEGRISSPDNPQSPQPKPGPKPIVIQRSTDKYHLRQEGMTLAVRVNW